MGILNDEQIKELEKTRLKEWKEKYPTSKIPQGQGTFQCVFNSVQDVLRYNQNSINPEFSNCYNNCLFNLDIAFTSDILNDTELEIGEQNFGKEFKYVVKNIVFDNSHFAGSVKFERMVLSGELGFNNCLFSKEVEFHNVHLPKCDISIIGCKSLSKFQFAPLLTKECQSLTVWESEIDELILWDVHSHNFNVLDFPIRLNKSTFNKPIDCSNVIFEKKVECKESTLPSVTCYNTTFKSTADFYSTTFTEQLCFDKTDFKGTIVFANTIFDKKVIFLYTQLYKNMILRGAQFNGGVNFALLNFLGEGRLNTFDLTLDDFPSDTEFIDGVYVADKEEFLQDRISQKHKQETFRILKHEAIQLSDHIKAIKYYKLEMAEYKKRLPFWSGEWFNKTTLFFNNISSGYGTNQLRGILFTLGVTLLFYNLFLLTADKCDSIDFVWNLNNISANVKAFLQFFNVTNWDFEPLGIGKDTYNWAYVFLVVGRIFIGYGIYQTVQAFRKFGRKI